MLNGANNEKPKEMTCYNVDNFSMSWKFPNPELVTKLKCMFTIEFDTQLLIYFRKY